ncbi:hypothetical protein DFAR_570038 [Desulfarculales bacterium]
MAYFPGSRSLRAMEGQPGALAPGWPGPPRGPHKAGALWGRIALMPGREAIKAFKGFDCRIVPEDAPSAVILTTRGPWAY